MVRVLSSGRGAARQLDLFTTIPGPVAVRDAQDLMSWPFFSLAKTKRIAPIDFALGETRISVEAVPEHGMATIWDADVLIWAASQLVAARDADRPTSRLIGATPYEILSFIGRGTSRGNYDRLKAALDRLQSTTIATTIRQQHQRRRHRFSWINEWRELADGAGRPLGIELILPDWLYAGIMDSSLILTIDRSYFSLTGGLERWLYRLVRKHGGHQKGGWSFDIAHLHHKSGVLSPLKRFAFELRQLVSRQPLPGYRLTLQRSFGQERLAFTAMATERQTRLIRAPPHAVGKPVDKPVDGL